MDATLERERSLNNIIDTMYRIDERLRRVEEMLNSRGGQVLVPQPERGTFWELFIQEMAFEDADGALVQVPQLRAREQ